MYQCSNKFKFYLFADDTNILYADKNLKTLEVTVNAELRNFCDWLKSNKLSLDTKKSNFVLFHSYQKRASYPRGGGYSLIWAIWGRAAGQGMVFGLAVLNRLYNLTCLCPKQVKSLS